MLSFFRMCPKLLMPQAISFFSLTNADDTTSELATQTLPQYRPATSYYTEHTEGGGYSAKGRNSRVPKNANHGKRPCCSVMRRLKRANNHSRRARRPDPTPEDIKTDPEILSESGSDEPVGKPESDYYLLHEEDIKEINEKAKINSSE
eukprot:TRINITY_DN3809_c0_g1_i11.p3 TRINITY_DN3809_c0_g1~~TRINITY_DN3809_c0_g1_i11.p3  ORF type:complete len:148 (-),score=47.79 TRINITY_DN3809_c0_g1_i11:156-599(-)